jgi:hypothetical protein
MLPMAVMVDASPFYGIGASVIAIAIAAYKSPVQPTVTAPVAFFAS